MPTSFVLASTSPHRRAMLTAAGLDFEAVAPTLDERAVEDTLEGSGVTPAEVADILAQAKAETVSDGQPGRIVLGCDQTLALGDDILHKPRDMEEARRRLLALSGKTHILNSAAVLVRDGAVLWRGVSSARMTMRHLNPAFVGRHLAAVGNVALSSVGAYQIEGPGIQLFERIEGDVFTIIGVPLLPLLAALRDLKLIES